MGKYSKENIIKVDSDLTLVDIGRTTWCNAKELIDKLNKHVKPGELQYRIATKEEIDRAGKKDLLANEKLDYWFASGPEDAPGDPGYERNEPDFRRCFYAGINGEHYWEAGLMRGTVFITKRHISRNKPNPKKTRV